jgi:hypothetical protein
MKEGENYVISFINLNFSFYRHRRTRRMLRWEDNISMSAKGIECHGVRWIILAQDKDDLQDLVNMVMHLWLPKSQGIY